MVNNTNPYKCGKCGKEGHNRVSCGKSLTLPSVKKRAHKRELPPFANRNVVNENVSLSHVVASHSLTQMGLSFAENATSAAGTKAVGSDDEGFAGLQEIFQRKDTSPYLAEVHSPISVVGRVVFTKNITYTIGYNMNNTTKLVVLDVGGKNVSFFSSADWVWEEELSEGDVVIIDGVVKSHKESGYEPTTALHRVKLVEIFKNENEDEDEQVT